MTWQEIGKKDIWGSSEILWTTLLELEKNILKDIWQDLEKKFEGIKPIIYWSQKEHFYQELSRIDFETANHERH